MQPPGRRLHILTREPQSLRAGGGFSETKPHTLKQYGKALCCRSGKAKSDINFIAIEKF